MSWLDEVRLRNGSMWNEKTRKEEIAYIPQIVGKVGSVIDFGCSTGWLLDLLVAEKKYGVEIDPKAKRICERKYPVYDHISQALKVDLITIVDVIEHLDTEECLRLLSEVHQKLNEAGELFIQTCNPYCLIASMNFWDDFSHKRMYGMTSICTLLQLNGFMVRKKSFIQVPWIKKKWTYNMLRRLAFFVPERYFAYNFFVLARKI